MKELREDAMHKDGQEHSGVSGRALLSIMFLLLVAATMPVSGQECPPKDREPDIVYDHKSNLNLSYDPIEVAPGKQIVVEIQNTCKEAFDYVSQALERDQSTREAANGECKLQSVFVCIKHEAQNGAYIVNIDRKSSSGLASELKSIRLVIPVRVRSWSLGFSSGPTISQLTDPVFATTTRTVDDEEETFIIRDRAAEDDWNLGLAAFSHVSYDRWSWGPWTPGLAAGLGLDERNEASYYLGFGVRAGDKALLTVGHTWGSVRRLPSGLSAGDVVDSADVLKDLPSRTADKFFFAVSFGFGGGKEQFEKKIKAPGPGEATVAEK